MTRSLVALLIICAGGFVAADESNVRLEPDATTGTMVDIRVATGGAVLRQAGTALRRVGPMLRVGGADVVTGGAGVATGGAGLRRADGTRAAGGAGVRRVAPMSRRAVPVLRQAGSRCDGWGWRSVRL